MHRNPKHERFFFGPGTKRLLPSLSLCFRHEERETRFFYADCSFIVSFQLTDSTNARAHPAVHKLAGLAQVRKINPLRLSPNLNSLLLFKITKNPSPSLPGMTLLRSPVSFLSGIFIVTSVIVISSPHAHEHLHSMCTLN